jgi:3-dehydroquinate dehydratase-2
MKGKIIHIIDGPNLNLTGRRETDIYGKVSVLTYLDKISSEFPTIQIKYFQSNIEGEIIDRLHIAGKNAQNPVIINPGGYSHTSVAIADAIRAIDNEVIEVHISNVHQRESFRQDMISGSACNGIISGLGLDSYKMALIYFQEKRD